MELYKPRSLYTARHGTSASSAATWMRAMWSEDERKSVCKIQRPTPGVQICQVDMGFANSYSIRISVNNFGGASWPE